MPSRIAKIINALTGKEEPKKRKPAKKAERKTPAKKAKKAPSKPAEPTPAKPVAKKAAKTKAVNKSPAAKKTAAKETVKATKKTAPPKEKKVKAPAAKKPAKKPAKKAAKKTAKKAAKKTAKKAAKKKAPKKAAKKTAKKAAKSAVHRAAAQAVKDSRSASSEERIAVKKAVHKRPAINWSKVPLESLQGQDPRSREWDPNHSKVRAAIENGLSPSYFRVHRVLYIGAAHGFTIAHICDDPVEIYAVEKSPEMMRHFLPLAEDLPSVLPIFGDAAYPDSYAHLLTEKMDVVFQDIAQKDQVGIFLANCEHFLSHQGVGMLVIKAPSVSSTAEPAAIFADTRKRLEESGATIVQEVTLEPYQKHHRLYVIHLNPYFDW